MEGNVTSNKQKVLRSWSECYEEPFGLQERTDNDSGVEQAMCIQTAEPYIEPAKWYRHRNGNN